MNSGANSKENTIMNRSEQEGNGTLTQSHGPDGRFLNKDSLTSENTLTNELASLRTIPSAGQSLMINEQGSTSQIIKNLGSEDLSAGGSMSSGSGSIPYMKNLDSRLHQQTINESPTSDNQIVSLIENTQDKNFETNSQSGHSSSVSSKVDSEGLQSRSRQSSGESNLLRFKSLKKIKKELKKN